MKTCLITLALLLLLISGCDHSNKQNHLPNIVIILADDMGYGDPQCYNPSSKVPTPHIDKLAAEGMRFTDAHSPSSVCTPTRYGLITGRYCWRTALKSGVLWGYDLPLIEDGLKTLPKVLQDAGYQTACIGKWHLGLPWQLNDPCAYQKSDKPDFKAGQEDVNIMKPLRKGGIRPVGFDYFFGIPASLDMDPYLYLENDKAVQLPGDSAAGSQRAANDYDKGFWRGGPASPTFDHKQVLPKLTQKTRQYIDQQKEGRDPFFLYFALTAPHTPWLPLDEYKGISKAGKYGDFVAMVDDVVGQVMSTIENNGLEENTLLLFTSDNGAHIDYIGEEYQHKANAEWRGQKADIHEGGHRIPLIVKWPDKVANGSVSNQMVCLTDIMATLAEITNQHLTDNEAIDSYSFLPILQKKDNGSLRQHLVMHSMDGMFSIRKGDWKLIDGRGSGGFTSPQRINPGPYEPEGQLYNLNADPTESNNVYSEEPDIVNELKRLLRTVQNKEVKNSETN